MMPAATASLMACAGGGSVPREGHTCSSARRRGGLCSPLSCEGDFDLPLSCLGSKSLLCPQHQASLPLSCVSVQLAPAPLLQVLDIPRCRD